MDPRKKQPKDPQQLRILSFNIRHGTDAQGKEALAAQAQVIKGTSADIVLLQEVDRNTHRSGNRDQLEILRETTGLEHTAFGKNLDFEGGGYGNAILSRFELDSVENYRLPLPAASKEPRGVLYAHIKNVQRVQHILVTHFPLQPSERLSSVGYVLRLIEQLKGPVLLGGDMNAGMRELARHEYDVEEYGSDASVVLLREYMTDALVKFSAHAGTYPADAPQTHLDFLFLREGTRAGDYRFCEFTIIESTSSDHRPVLATLGAPRSEPAA